MPPQTTPIASKAAQPADGVLPYDLVAEMAVLGCLLIDQTAEAPAIEKAIALLKPSDFYRPDNGLIYTAMLALQERGEPVDLTTLPSELKSMGVTGAAGGLEYLTSLYDKVSTSHNAETYAKIVAEKAGLRDIQQYFQRLANAAMAPDADLSKITQQAEFHLSQIIEQSPAIKAGAPRRKPLEKRMVDLADIEAPSEFPLMFGPYLLKGTAHWLTGQTGLGKSTWAYNVACALAEGNPLWGIDCEPVKILYVDMESGDVGRALKIERLYRDAPRVRGKLIFMREPIKLPGELPALLKYIQANEIELVIFDTARRVFSVKDENDNAEFYNTIAPTLDGLKQIGVASLTMGHPSKAGNGSARGAGAQEDAGDVNLSLTLFRGEINDPDSVIVLRVTKNRLLGHVPPLFLKRIGDDQFERSEVAVTSPQEEPITKQLQCRQFLMDTLQNSANPISHGILLKMAEASGIKKATFDRAWKYMKTENEVISKEDGYILADPFAE